MNFIPSACSEGREERVGAISASGFVQRYSKMILHPDFHFSFYWPWFVPLASKNSELTGYKMGKNRLLPGFPWQKHVSLPFLNDL